MLKRIAMITILSLLMATPALAAKPVPVESDIQIATLESWLGGDVTFDYTVERLKGNQWPLIYVECYEVGYLDVQERILYGQLDHPYVTFILGGGSSRWWLEPQDADCQASLWAYSFVQPIVMLAGPVTFEAEG